MKKLLLSTCFLILLSGCNQTSDNTYQSTIQTGKTFHGYECTDDCSGHKAGYDWAKRKGIDSPDDCGGKSNSFIEGCKAYAQEN